MCVPPGVGMNLGTAPIQMRFHALQTSKSDAVLADVLSYPGRTQCGLNILFNRN